jgi:hypothetical protein
MENGGPNRSNPQYKNKKPTSLKIDTEEDESNVYRTPISNTPNRLRGNKDLRSPGMQKTPSNAQAAKMPDQGAPLPDFITQTDANGNATTPRSAQAIEGARKVHPSGPKPHLHINKNGKLTEDDENSNDSDDSSKGIVEETCISIVDSFRFMCCCIAPPDAKCLTGKETQDSDEKSRVKLLGDLHPDDTGKKCLVLDLDETLVHSSFRAVPGADFVIPVQVRFACIQRWT